MTQGKLPLSATGTDAAKIAAIVSERHGIVLAPDDPAMAIVTMNALVLQAKGGEMLGAMNKLMVARIAELRAVLATAEKQAGQTIDAHARATASHFRNALREEIAARGRASAANRPRRAPAYRRYLAFAVVALAIFAYGFWVGRS
jgi:hypothetical protein